MLTFSTCFSYKIHFPVSRLIYFPSIHCKYYRVNILKSEIRQLSTAGMISKEDRRQKLWILRQFFLPLKIAQHERHWSQCYRKYVFLDWIAICRRNIIALSSDIFSARTSVCADWTVVTLMEQWTLRQLSFGSKIKLGSRMATVYCVLQCKFCIHLAREGKGSGGRYKFTSVGRHICALW